MTLLVSTADCVVESVNGRVILRVILVEIGIVSVTLMTRFRVLLIVPVATIVSATNLGITRLSKIVLDVTAESVNGRVIFLVIVVEIVTVSVKTRVIFLVRDVLDAIVSVVRFGLADGWFR